MQASTCNVDVYNMKLYAPLTHNARHLSTQTLNIVTTQLAVMNLYVPQGLFSIPTASFVLVSYGDFQGYRAFSIYMYGVLCHILIFTVIANSC